MADRGNRRASSGRSNFRGSSARRGNNNRGDRMDRQRWDAAPSHTSSAGLSGPGSEIMNINPYNVDKSNRIDFPRPREIGHFSVTGSRQYLFGDSTSLSVLSDIPAESESVAFDLDRGYESFISKDCGNQKLDALLRFLVDERTTLMGAVLPDKVFPTYEHASTGDTLVGSSAVCSAATRPPPDFVSFRGCLTSLLTTSYENYDGWLMGVTKFRGTHYICLFDSEEKQRKKATETTRQKVMGYWGHKFETYVTADTPGGEPDTCAPVNCYKEFCSVVRGRIGSHSLVYGGEVDCYNAASVRSGMKKVLDKQELASGVNEKSGSNRTGSNQTGSEQTGREHTGSEHTGSEHTGSEHGKEKGVNGSGLLSKEEGASLATRLAAQDCDSAYVELKTSRMIEQRRQDIVFREKKLPKWWAQSFLLNVPEIVCGFRDDRGMVKQLVRYKTEDLPRMAGKAWDKATCLSFANQFLCKVKDLDLPDDSGRVCLFEWEFQADRVKVIRDAQQTNADFLFLPDWFVSQISGNHGDNHSTSGHRPN